MKFLKYFAIILCCAGSLFFLFNVFFGRKIEWNQGSHEKFVIAANASIGISILLFIFYNLETNNRKQALKWLILLIAIATLYLLLSVVL